MDQVVEDLLSCLDDPALALLQWNDAFSVVQARALALPLSSLPVALPFPGTCALQLASVTCTVSAMHRKVTLPSSLPAVASGSLGYL